MLVLTRRIGEEIIINGNIRVKVVAVYRDKIRLGFSAPPSVSVDRKEIHDRRIEFECHSECAPPACPRTGPRA
jgi:carbon storage regulator